jgi:hypothetical protein
MNAIHTSFSSLFLSLILGCYNIDAGSHSTDTTSETDEFGAPYSSETVEIYTDNAAEYTLDHAQHIPEEDSPSGSTSAVHRRGTLSPSALGRLLLLSDRGRSPSSHARHTMAPASARDTSLRSR